MSDHDVKKPADVRQPVQSSKYAPITSAPAIDDFAALRRAVNLPDHHPLTPRTVLQLQRTIGNRAVSRLLKNNRPNSLQRFEDDEIQLPARGEWERSGSKPNQSKEEEAEGWDKGIKSLIAHYIWQYKQGGGQPQDEQAQKQDFEAAARIWDHAKTKNIDVKWIDKAQIERLFNGKSVEAGTNAMIKELNGKHYEMLVKLKEPANLPPQYDVFCDLIFDKDDIMKYIMETDPNEDVGTGLNDLIYDQYGSSTITNDPSNQIGKGNYRAAFEYWDAINQAQSGGYLQNYKYSLNALTVEAINDLLNQKGGEAALNAFAKDFVYFFVDDSLSANYRVYANISKGETGSIAQLLFQQDGIQSFKFAGPFDIGTRADGLVVYCDSRDAAQVIGELLNTEITVFPGAPAMTEQVGGNPGLGIGAEPGFDPNNPQKSTTGMRTDLDDSEGENEEHTLAIRNYENGRQSFGGLRSELIASAVLHYQANKNLATGLNVEPLELFKRFVKLAITGWSEILEPPTK